MRVLMVPPEKCQFLHLDANTGTPNNSIYPQGGRTAVPAQQTAPPGICAPHLAQGSSRTAGAAPSNEQEVERIHRSSFQGPRSAPSLPVSAQRIRLGTDLREEEEE